MKHARLLGATVTFLIGDLEATLDWYKRVGFETYPNPPGFGIACRDDIKIFFQQQPGYTRPDDPLAREREAWNVYIQTDDVYGLFEELSQLPEVRITRPPCPQEYGQIEFDVLDPNGYVLVFAERVQQTAPGPDVAT